MSIQPNITSQIDAIKKKEISYRNLMQHGILTNTSNNEIIQIPFSSYTRMYSDLLSTIIIESKLDDRAQSEIRFKPKTLSYLLYGTTEFWNDLLILNECKSIFDFTPKTIRYYDPSRFKSYLNQILILEGVVK